MARRPDPAFLNNVPTTVATTSSFTDSVTTFLSTLTSTTSSTSTSLSSTVSETSSSTQLDDPGSVYLYTPLTAVAIFFAVFYSLLAIYHFYLSVLRPHIQKSVPQKHSYTIPLFVACISSTLGYVLRAVSTSPTNRSSINLYAFSQIFIIIAPIFICASLYLLISYLINLCLPSGPNRTFLGISPSWIGRIFITSDFLSFILQAIGSGIASSGDWQGPQQDVGMNILTVGLTIQLATFSFYMVIFVLFCVRVHNGKEESKKEEQLRLRHHDRAANSEDKRQFGFNPLTQQVVTGVWIGNVLIELRSIFRTIEFAMGAGGYLFRHEWTLWVFDAAPIWLALLVLGIYHPARWLQSKRRSFFMEKENGDHARNERWH